MTVYQDKNLTKRVQYRFPKSKRRRIRKKWSKDSKNWRIVPDDTIYIMGNRAICHPKMLIELKNHSKIITQPSGQKPLRGWTSNYLLCADEEIVDFPPESVKLAA